ncbi:MAG: hypothetical protein H7222_01865 [Methylotenera sp.]|nr:hypothetical protein [Oligoflexia bacterium]
MFITTLISQALLVSGFSETAGAWENHQPLLPYILEKLSDSDLKILSRKIPTEFEPSLRKRYETLATSLQLHPHGKLLSTAPDGKIATGAQLLAVALDDPDYGMDQDLPPTADPEGDRPFMGGLTGFRSQGFRHMFFGGWKFSHPIATFQIPTRALGQSPDRAALTGQHARELLHTGDFAWGLRVLGWSAHYIQDLAQPFHATQIPNLRMVPWSALLSWPPGKAFGNLVAETTRSITNFHYAYERYVDHELARGMSSRFYTCLTGTKPLQGNANPLFLAHDVADHSTKIASELGSALMSVYGKLKQPEFDLGNKKGDLDFDRYLEAPEMQNSKNRSRLDEVTCKALNHAVDSSALLIHWALQS